MTRKKCLKRVGKRCVRWSKSHSEGNHDTEKLIVRDYVEGKYNYSQMLKRLDLFKRKGTRVHPRIKI